MKNYDYTWNFPNAKEFDLKRQKYNELLLAEIALLVQKNPSVRFFQLIGWFNAYKPDPKMDLWDCEPWVIYEKYLESDLYKYAHGETK